MWHHPTEAREFFAPDGDPVIDSSLPIADVSGLNNYILPHPRNLRSDLSPVANATPRGTDGQILLMHDAGGDRSQTIAALPAIIHAVRARGLHLVTVPQLMADDPPPAGQPLPQNLSGD